ncbi:MAG: hypothetical protein HY831_05405 [Candidatus Aenigmarchaeota archaeon]|nr:hypothetical protein [Candidatus Aenigmarchaeota archaeon]
MKKQMQKTVMTIIIVVLLAMSTIAFVVISSVSPEQTTQTLELPKQSVIDGYINESYRQTYLSKGYTLMEYHYYDNCCKNISPFIDYLPEVIGTQLVVQKIKDTDYYINLESAFGTEEKIKPDTNEDLLRSLCKVLTKTPIDCGLLAVKENSSSG